MRIFVRTFVEGEKETEVIEMDNSCQNPRIGQPTSYLTLQVGVGYLYRVSSSLEYELSIYKDRGKQTPRESTTRCGKDFFNFNRTTLLKTRFTTKKERRDFFFVNKGCERVCVFFFFHLLLKEHVG